jgi:cytoskeleton protein RodZ
VSDLSNVPPEEAPAPYVPPTAGGELRAARVAAGLDIDVIAQQLKLAPRQVQALEDDDYAKLPGRTFVRGFVRNYARLLQLDPDDVVALLPGADVAPSLERPTITPSRRAMGELPADAPARRAWTRWAIPLVLIAIIVAAGVYEFRRPQGEPRRVAVGEERAFAHCHAGRDDRDAAQSIVGTRRRDAARGSRQHGRAGPVAGAGTAPAARPPRPRAGEHGAPLQRRPPRASRSSCSRSRGARGCR